MEAEFPQWLSKVRPNGPIISTQETIQLNLREDFDLASVLKASQAISTQLVYSELLGALMQIVIENAGAQVGYLLLPAPERGGERGRGRGGDTPSHPLAPSPPRPLPPSQNEWLIVASSGADGEILLSETPVNEGGEVSAAIVRYVARKGQALVLNDALHEGQFFKDPDLVRKQAKSILCMPLINQGHLQGILYLENNLTTHSFTPDRIELLNLLSSQAAISLENATLYHTLEEKVAERTAALEQEIKERKLAEEAAQAANHAKSAFLTNMSHELRSPLNAILGYARILKRQPSGKKQAEIIEQSGQHLLTLINDLLDIAKIESGKIELQPQVVDLPKMLQLAVDMMRIRAQRKGISFRYIASPTLPTLVLVDEKRLRQILINLLSNAIKFTPSASKKGEKKGRVIFSVLRSQREMSEQGAETTLLSFEIEDNGIGIPNDKLEVIFEPFKQVSASDSQEGTLRVSTLAGAGTGLGLTISRHLVELMGGTLRVSSQLGEGSTFSFELRLPTVAQPPKSVVERRIIGFKAEAGTIKEEELSVLIVDDKWQSRAILADLLTPLGFKVYEAANGQEALVLALELRPKIVLTDLVMPVLSGIELIAHLRASALKDIVIIAFSASAFFEDKHNSLAAGCNAFLPKPINPAQLFATLQEHLPIEWVYEASTDEKASPTALSNDYQPPTEQLTSLLAYAQVGDIQALIRHSEQLLAQEPAADAFVSELQQLAKAFKMRQLRQWLTSLLKDSTS